MAGLVGRFGARRCAVAESDGSTPWAYFAATAVAGLLGLVFRPMLALVAARIGWVAVVLAGLVGQALLVYAAIWIVPGISASFWSAFWASWIVAVVGTAAAWLGSSGTDDSFTASLLRRRVGHSTVADPEVDGVVFVQLDGVAFPVLRWAIQAGAVATLRRWVTSGDYVLREWTAQLPCTTPASQLGILHGTVAGVPAFRWYDRELGRVLIANRPDDAAIIEQRATTGAGLLADDGLAIGNLFTGDAPRAVLTMSRLGAGRDRRSHGRRSPGSLPTPTASPAAWCGRSPRWRRRDGRLPDRTGSISCREFTADGSLPVSAPPPTSCNAISTPRSSQRRCARVQEHLRRLRRLRRDSPPRRHVPPGGHGGPRRFGSGSGNAGATVDSGCPALSHRGRLRPRSSQGQTFRDRFGADLGEVCTGS